MVAIYTTLTRALCRLLAHGECEFHSTHMRCTRCGERFTP